MIKNNQREGKHILALVKVLRKFGQFSANKELSFSWYDAATLSQRVRNLGQHEGR